MDFGCVTRNVHFDPGGKAYYDGENLLISRRIMSSRIKQSQDFTKASQGQASSCMTLSEVVNTELANKNVSQESLVNTIRHFFQTRLEIGCQGLGRQLEESLSTCSLAEEAYERFASSPSDFTQGESLDGSKQGSLYASEEGSKTQPATADDVNASVDDLLDQLMGADQEAPTGKRNSSHLAKTVQVESTTKEVDQERLLTTGTGRHLESYIFLGKLLRQDFAPWFETLADRVQSLSIGMTKQKVEKLNEELSELLITGQTQLHRGAAEVVRVANRGGETGKLLDGLQSGKMAWKPRSPYRDLFIQFPGAKDEVLKLERDLSDLQTCTEQWQAFGIWLDEINQQDNQTGDDQNRRQQDWFESLKRSGIDVEWQPRKHATS